MQGAYLLVIALNEVCQGFKIVGLVLVLVSVGSEWDLRGLLVMIS